MQNADGVPVDAEAVCLLLWVSSDLPSLVLLLQFLFLSEVLQWRSQTTPDHVLFTLLSSRVRAFGERLLPSLRRCIWGPIGGTVGQL